MLKTDKNNWEKIKIDFLCNIGIAFAINGVPGGRVELTLPNKVITTHASLAFSNYTRSYTHLLFNSCRISTTAILS
ncbi:unnamed protein product [Sphenostylis stenocarpa]|uniref:Uncharacterized protein n=1 Tax=Sphenostylis stenocarpa TaxID=92480 RepID=A0AA86S4J1_9FABA|nr:unnamed protein product [Sphenostylis stenocarpa]